MRIVIASMVALALTGCGGGTTPALLGADSTARSQAVRPNAGMRIYTANRNAGSVIAFAANASGNVSPVVTIAGSNTTLTNPDSIALDAVGNIYTANDSGTTVAVFSPHANGNVAPKKTIGGTKSHLGPTEGLLIDPSGNLWVTDFRDNAITEYAAGTHGNVTPIDTISGSDTQLDTPTGMAMDSSGRLFVANPYGPYAGSIVAFASGSSGDATPVVSISGSNTGLSRPYALAFDTTGRLLVADEDKGVVIFASGANGNVAPVATISGMSMVDGIATDPQDHIYAAGYSGPINEYHTNAHGNATPIRSIGGSNTTIDGVEHLVVR